MLYTTPEEVKEILSRDPVKVKLITDDYFIENNIREISVPNMFEPNTIKFHPLGLFSEEIFGPLTDLSRYVNEAFIDLHSHIIHPVIFAFLFEKKALYTSIMSGKRFAKFDTSINNFVLADENDPKAKTGYKFFIDHLPLLTKAKEPESLRAKNLHQLLVKNKNNLTIRRLLVIPAGLRDVDLRSGRLSKDDINRLYLSILNLATSLSKYDLSEDTIFDGIRFQIQLKVAEIFKYIENIAKGKKGFFQKHYGDRKIAYSTRNVVSTPIIEADSPDHPVNIKSDETGVPLRQAIIAFHPFFINFIKKKLYNELFLHGNAENIPVTSPKTLELEYISIRTSEMNRYTTSEGIDRVISQFKHVGFRESPVSIQSIERKEYWLLLKYEKDDKVYISKSANDLKRMVEIDGVDWNRELVKPVTWAESLYLAGLQITTRKFVLVTRFPVTGETSIYPSRVHLLTTIPAKEVEIVFEGARVRCYHYPITGKPYFESAIPHQSRLSGLNADFDGDMISLTAVWLKESNDELEKHMNEVSTLVGSDLTLKIKADMNLVELAVHNLSV